MQKITPFLWFENQAEEAAKFYTSIFSAKGRSASGGKKTKTKNVAFYDEAGAKASGRPPGSAMTVEFELEGQDFIALNGGPVFKLTEAISFVVSCENQEEVDYFWEKLSAHPESEQCGWLKDKYGLSWQIVPAALGEMLSDPDTQKAGRVMKAMLQMKKIDIKKLKQAYDKG